MAFFSRMLVCACAGALIAGCGSAPNRTGKGNDHEIMNLPAHEEQRAQSPSPDTGQGNRM